MKRFRFDEQSSNCIEGNILDREGEPVPAASLTDATLTLYDLETGANDTGSPRPGILNERDTQDILNANDVVIDTDGHFIWSVQPEDNVIVDGRKSIERHRALLMFTWATGQFPCEVEIEVMNLRKVG